MSESGTNFIKFQLTDFKKDAAQTVVPYIDVQTVSTNPATPLQGIGIYYKGTKGFGGFVGLKLLTADIFRIYTNKTKIDFEMKNIDEIIEFYRIK